jgi:hypothetical protein
MSRGAKCVITFYLFDATKTVNAAWHSISDVCAIANPEAPEHGVAYLERYVQEQYGKRGLQIATEIPGAKRGKPTSNPNPQDIVIAIKPDTSADPLAASS